MIFRFKWWGQWGVRIATRINIYLSSLPSGRRPRICVWPRWLPKDAQRICIIRVRCLGGSNETHTYVLPISVICCVALFPAKSMVPPCFASLHHRLRHFMFEFVFILVTFAFIFMIIVIVFAPVSLPFHGSLVSSLPPQLDIEILVWFSELCRCSLFFFFLFLPSFLSYRAVLLLVHHLDIS